MHVKDLYLFTVIIVNRWWFIKHEVSVGNAEWCVSRRQLHASSRVFVITELYIYYIRCAYLCCWNICSDVLLVISLNASHFYGSTYTHTNLIRDLKWLLVNRLLFVETGGVRTVHKKRIGLSTQFYISKFGRPRTRSDLPRHSRTVSHLQTPFSSRIFAKCMPLYRVHVGWLPVHQDQLWAQRSVTSMGQLYFFSCFHYLVPRVTSLWCWSTTVVWMMTVCWTRLIVCSVLIVIAINRVPTHPGKSWIFLWIFQALESPGNFSERSWKVLDFFRSWTQLCRCRCKNAAMCTSLNDSAVKPILSHFYSPHISTAYIWLLQLSFMHVYI